MRYFAHKGRNHISALCGKVFRVRLPASNAHFSFRLLLLIHKKIMIMKDAVHKRYFDCQSNVSRGLLLFY